MGLIDAVGDGPIAIDTAVFIYFLEEHPVFLPIVEPLFEAIDAGRLRAVTSTLTLLETLVVPYRAGNIALAAQYEALLVRSRHLSLVDIDRPLLRAAAALRARHAIKTPDALQVAAALSAGCRSFVTNDRKLPTIPGLEVIDLGTWAV